MTTATIALEIPDAVCRDLLTACFEGGSAYWLSCDRAVYTGHDTDAYGVKKIVGCEDVEDSKTKWGDATYDTMRHGFQLLLAPGADVSSTIKKDAAMCLIDYENANWDADTADAVLQFGLLGELVYG